MIRRVISYIFFLMLGSGYCSAQELVVKSVSMQPEDRSAVEKPVLDANNDTCALIKIKVGNLKDLQFTSKEQYVGDVKYENGEYLIYKSINISRMISYQHQDYVPGVIDLAEYGYRRLKSGKTYIVNMEAPLSRIGKSIVALKVIPTTANVTFNNTDAQVTETGIYEFSVGAGTYSYVVQAPNYLSKSGAVTIEQDATKTFTIRLSPITHQVDIDCDINNAHVFVDNIDYGKVGKLELPQGQHVIRIQAEGYIDIEEVTDIDEKTRQLSYQMKKNENRVDIHATSVTIISSSKHIYKNNKELKDWKSGTPIKFMPGKYMLSNDYGQSKIIEVGSTPMEVTL